MPNAIADLTNLDGLLKDHYDGKLVNWVEREQTLLERIERTTDRRNFEGRQGVLAFKDGITQAAGTRAEYGVLPTAKRSSVGQMLVGMAHHYAVIELTRQLIAQSASNAGAFAQAIELEVSGARETLTQMMARQYGFGDGTGWVARVKTVDSGTQCTMYAQPTDPGYPGARFLNVGMACDGYNGTGSGATQRTGVFTVAAVTPGSAVVTFDTTTNLVAGDYLFLDDSFRTDAMGLGGIVDDGDRVATFQNKSRASVVLLKANTMDNGGTLRPWSPALMDQLCGRARQLHGSGWPTLLVSRVELTQRAADFMRRARNTEPGSYTFKNGYKGLAWETPNGTIPWLDDFNARDNEIQAIHEPSLLRFVLEEIQFDRYTGSMWIENGSRKHAYEARLFTFQNMASRMNKLHSTLQDVSYTM